MTVNLNTGLKPLKSVTARVCQPCHWTCLAYPVAVAMGSLSVFNSCNVFPLCLLYPLPITVPPHSFLPQLGLRLWTELSFCFSMPFWCPVTIILAFTALRLSLSLLEVYTFFFTLTLLIHVVAQKTAKLLSVCRQ